MVEKTKALVHQTERDELLTKIQKICRSAPDTSKKKVYRWAFEQMAQTHFSLSTDQLKKQFFEEEMLALQDIIFEKAQALVRWQKPLRITGQIPLFLCFGLGYILYRDDANPVKMLFPAQKVVMLHAWYKEKYGVWRDYYTQD